MTKTEWQRCDDISLALHFLEGRLSSRQIGLFVIACARRWWTQITGPVLVRAGEVAEQFVLGRATPEELDAAFRSVLSLQQKYGEPIVVAIQARALYWMTNVTTRGFGVQNGYETAGAFASLAEMSRVGKYETKVQMAMLRDIFGDPFDPMIPEPGWFTSTAASLAQGIYEEQAFDRLPILADALQDAGCDDPRVLTHCREPGAHVRGCWVVDMVLRHERLLTAEEWETTADVGRMIRTVWPRTTERKLRLVACGCCRQVTEAESMDWWWWPALLAAERVADELEPTHDQRMSLEHDRYSGDGGSTGWAFGALSWIETRSPATIVDHAAEWLSADAVNRSCDPDPAYGGGPAWEPVASERQTASLRVMRCVLGNPLRPPVTFPKKWKSAAVVKLAREIYDNHSFERMPELAGRLERAGCTDAAVLAHCREPGPFPGGPPADYPVPVPPVHTRGCWVVDTILGLE